MGDTTEAETRVAPLVRVVVVNYDGGAVTLRCIDSLLATEHPADRLEIVVVDNASIDGVEWILREQYPQVRLIVNDTNEGFARGCNLAMRDLDGVDFVALVNNDAIVEPDWLAPLIDAAAEPDVGAVCPKLLFNVRARAMFVETPVSALLPDGRAVGVAVASLLVDGVERLHTARVDERFWADERAALNDRGVRWTKQPIASMWWAVDETDPPNEVIVRLRSLYEITVRVGDGRTAREVTVTPAGTEVSLQTDGFLRVVNSAGGGLYEGWFGGDRGFVEPDIGQYDEPSEVFSWCGGAVLLSTGYLRDVGIFDSSYFLYYEDFDLSWRGRLQGWKYLYVPTSTVFHEHAYSSKAGSEFFRYWVDRNRRLTLVKNAPARVAVRAIAGIARGLALDLVRHAVNQFRRRRPPSPWWLRGRMQQLGQVVGALPGALAERRRLARSRVVGDDEIASWTLTK